MAPSIARIGFFVAVLLATACTARAPAHVAPSAPSAPPPSAKLRVATSGNYPPFSEWKADGLKGFAPALVRSFAAAEHTEVEWNPFEWSDLLAQMRAGHFDIAGDGISVLPERSILGRFTVPIARGTAVLLLRRPAWAKRGGSHRERTRDIVRALDRPELRVAVNRGGRLEVLSHRLFRNARILAVSENAGREALGRGDADAVLSDSFEVLRFMEGLRDLERIGPLGDDVTALWVRADLPDLAERLDRWLVDEEESGRLGEVRTSLLGPGGGSDTARPVGAILAATLEQLALVPFVTDARKRAKKALTDPAADERALASAADAVKKAASSRGTPPPPRALVDAFFRAQLAAASSAAQRAAPLDAKASTYSLDEQLTPAVGRIFARMAFLLVRIPGGLTREAILADAREELADSGLLEASIDPIASAIAAFSQR